MSDHGKSASCHGCPFAELDRAKRDRDRYWLLLCNTVEALGCIAPEAAPYAPRWAKRVRERMLAAEAEAQNERARCVAVCRSVFAGGWTEEGLRAVVAVLEGIDSDARIDAPALTERKDPSP